MTTTSAGTARVHRSALAALLLASALTITLLASPASARAKTRGDLVVIGDSISSLQFYNQKKGHAKRAWWSFLASRTHLTPRVFAEGGSGYGLKGKCIGTSVDERITAAARRLKHAKAIVVAAGVNDFRECVQREDGTWRLEISTTERRQAAITATLAHLDDLVVGDSRVYVTVPYGVAEARAPFRDEIAGLVEAAAVAQGFQYVDMAHGTLDARTTRDATHPNEAGSKAMYRAMYYGSNMRTRFR